MARASNEGLAARLWRLRYWWIVPMAVVLVAITALVLIARDASQVPFIYTLF